MLRRGDEQGKTILQGLMEKESSLIPDACSEIVNYYCYKGERDEAAKYYHTAVDFMKTNEDVVNERDKLTLADKFIPHDLGYDTIMKLRQDLIDAEEVKRAYVVVKYTELSSQFPLYVIGIEYKSRSSAERDEIQQKLLEKKLLPWEYWIVSLNDNRELDYKMNMIPESRLV